MIEDLTIFVQLRLMAVDRLNRDRIQEVMSDRRKTSYTIHTFPHFHSPLPDILNLTFQSNWGPGKGHCTESWLWDPRFWVQCTCFKFRERITTMHSHLPTRSGWRGDKVYIWSRSHEDWWFTARWGPPRCLCGNLSGRKALKKRRDLLLFTHHNKIWHGLLWTMCVGLNCLSTFKLYLHLKHVPLELKTRLYRVWKPVIMGRTGSTRSCLCVCVCVWIGLVCLMEGTKGKASDLVAMVTWGDVNMGALLYR